MPKIIKLDGIERSGLCGNGPPWSLVAAGRHIALPARPRPGSSNPVYTISIEHVSGHVGPQDPVYIMDGHFVLDQIAIPGMSIVFEPTRLNDHSGWRWRRVASFGPATREKGAKEMGAVLRVLVELPEDEDDEDGGDAGHGGRPEAEFSGIGLDVRDLQQAIALVLVDAGMAILSRVIAVGERLRKKLDDHAFNLRAADYRSFW